MQKASPRLMTHGVGFWKGTSPGEGAGPGGAERMLGEEPNVSYDCCGCVDFSLEDCSLWLGSIVSVRRWGFEVGNVLTLPRHLNQEEGG